jgi:hypothetical protein
VGENLILDPLEGKDLEARAAQEIGDGVRFAAPCGPALNRAPH